MSETQHTVTARKRRRCDDGSFYCWQWIEPGQQYLRAVAFPGSEVNPHRYGEPNRPRVLNVCGGCTTLIGHAPKMRRRRRR